MENILFEKEVCRYLDLPSIPKKVWDKESPFDKGVAVVTMGFNNKGYAVVRFDKEKELSPNVIKVFSSEPFYEIEEIFIVPDYMETNVDAYDLDESSKERALELIQQAEEITSTEAKETVSSKDIEQNPYFFDNITNDEEAIAYITSYNKKNGIKGSVPKKHDTIIMRLAVIYADTQKASGFNG